MKSRIKKRVVIGPVINEGSLVRAVREGDKVVAERWDPVAGAWVRSGAMVSDACIGRPCTGEEMEALGCPDSLSAQKHPGEPSVKFGPAVQWQALLDVFAAVGGPSLWAAKEGFYCGLFGRLVTNERSVMSFRPRAIVSFFGIREKEPKRPAHLESNLKR